VIYRTNLSQLKLKLLLVKFWLGIELTQTNVASDYSSVWIESDLIWDVCRISVLGQIWVKTAIWLLQASCGHVATWRCSL